MANAVIGLGSRRAGPPQLAARARQWLRRLREQMRRGAQAGRG